jgi:threonine synthase
VRELWGAVDQGQAFDLKASGEFARVPEFGFVSGSSTHAKRIDTIRRVWNEHGVMIDPHTADGVKVGLEQRRAGVPLICLETALPAKFDGAIHEALGREPERPRGLEDIESLPRRYEVLDADVGQVRDFVSAHAND